MWSLKIFSCNVCERKGEKREKNQTTIKKVKVIRIFLFSLLPFSSPLSVKRLLLFLLLKNGRRGRKQKARASRDRWYRWSFNIKERWSLFLLFSPLSSLSALLSHLCICIYICISPSMPVSLSLLLISFHKLLAILHVNPSSLLILYLQLTQSSRKQILV